MDHKYWEEKLHGFIDNELEPADQLAVEKHIRSCPDCEANVAYFQSMKGRLRMHASSVEIPASVNERVTKMIKKQRNPLRRLFSPASGMALAAAILIAVFMPRSGSSYQFVEEIISGKIVCHDCAVAGKAGIEPGTLCDDGHRLGLATSDGDYWRFASDAVGGKYVNQFSLMGKQVRITGQLLDAEHLIRIRDLETVVARQASIF